MSKEITKLKDVHERLIAPVCALESLVNMNLDDPLEKEPIYECIALNLRIIIDEIEKNM